MSDVGKFGRVFGLQCHSLVWLVRLLLSNRDLCGLLLAFFVSAHRSAHHIHPRLWCGAFASISSDVVVGKVGSVGLGEMPDHGKRCHHCKRRRGTRSPHQAIMGYPLRGHTVGSATSKDTALSQQDSRWSTPTPS